MLERLRPFLENLASFLAPGLVLLLLGIQVAFGLRGFDQPAANALVVLQVPGILLGWGGVVLLMPLLVWMVLDWWGYSLGGFALKGLGSAVLGIAAGAFFGLFGGQGAGGVVGGGLADVLSGTVGTLIGAIVLTIMAIPAAVLAFSLRKPSARPEPAARKAAPTDDDAKGGLLAKITGLFRRDRTPVENRWYPKQRFDAWGNELPMQFGGSRDVGGIRFADEDEPSDAPTQPTSEGAPAPTTASAAATAGDPAAPDDAPETIADLLEGEERLPTIPELLAGKASNSLDPFADDPSGGARELASDAADEGPVHVGSAHDGERDTTHPETAYPSGWNTPAAKADEGLLPGVRYADITPAVPLDAEDDNHDEGLASDTDDPTAGTEDDPVVTADLGLSDAVAAAVRGPAPAPADAQSRMAASVREGVRRSVEALRGSGDGSTPEPKSRYLEKLEASGMFDFARPLTDPEPAKPTRKKAAAKKKAATKKAAAKKTAAKKKAPAKKKAAKKKAVAKKKAARKKAAPRKKAAAKKAPTKKKAAAKKRTLSERTAGVKVARRKAAVLESLRIERLDPLFARAVDAALERGSASSMLLTRTLGLPFGRANALLERMIGAGVIGEAGPSGSNPVLISKADWVGLGR